MPHKIPFRISHVSGQDESFKASELNFHSPLTKGWHSSRFCLYPQDIVIQLTSRTRIRKVQLLSHQHLIATKIEFYVGDVPEGSPINLQNARYTRLGYVALSSNEKTGFKARELKSVHVDAVGCFMKLVIHKNHINQFNLYNQVGVVAINVIGDEVNRLLNYFEVEDTHKEPNTQHPNRPDYISPLDDLAFDMYQDPEIAANIRKLEQIKLDAVEAEKYEYAKTLKLAIADLQKVGEKLGKMDVEKRQAVENEDYDTAQEKKRAMEELRGEIYTDVRLGELLAGEKAATPKQKPKVKPPIIKKTPSPEPLTSTPPERDHTPKTSPAKPTREAKQSPLNNDDRPLPALKNKAANSTNFIAKTPTPPPPETPPPRHIPSRGPSEAAPAEEIDTNQEDMDDDLIDGDSEASAMSEKDMREASSALDVFGLSLVSKAYSKMYTLRETAMQEMQAHLVDVSSKEEVRSTFRAAVFLVQRTMDDNVTAVFKMGLQILKYLLTDYIVQHRISRSDIAYAMEKVLPNLLHKCGDTAVRHREMAKEYINEMSKFPEVQTTRIVEQECVRPFKSNTPQRIAVGRVEIVEALYRDHGLTDHGLSVANLAPFCVQCLQNTIGGVREGAERLLRALYSDVGAPLKDYLPPDNDKTRKNTLYRNLFEYFDKVDGKPSKKDLRKQKMEAEIKKQVEIDTLQNQLQHLKDINAGKAPVNEGVIEDSNKQLHKKSLVKPKARGLDKNVKQNEILDDNISILNIDKTCIFCNVRDETFTDEGLDLHYWKECPMLKRCGHCKQVVEIAGLTDHMLTECDAKAGFSRCPRCTEAVQKSEFDQHVSEKSCND